MLGQSRTMVAFLVILVWLPHGHAQEKPKIFVGASSKTLGYSPLWVATKKGFFDQQGLDVQLVLLRGVPMTLQALAAGSLHFGSGGPSRTSKLRSGDSTLSSPEASSTPWHNFSSPGEITKLTKISAARPLAHPP